VVGPHPFLGELALLVVAEDVAELEDDSLAVGRKGADR
jgi:hypothetical protein